MTRQSLISSICGAAAVGCLVIGMGHIMHQSSLGAGLQPGKTVSVLVTYGILTIVFCMVGNHGVFATCCAVVCGLVAMIARAALIVLGIPLLIIAIASFVMGMGVGVENPMLIVLALIAFLAAPTFIF
ncbi:hypothetical protein TW83_10115 [Paracoccus sp. S4493]|uniref:hypothetical protein n=1 Tax=Paracoccus sp. S4493 TaxID=579490 RepID=UPI0005FA1D39|nr:hypothetical protein [Paracoccus sp. S4493]KJZ31265.1 hypothetical protein TW83_10115 [Paracoccus sp. S4493]